MDPGPRAARFVIIALVVLVVGGICSALSLRPPAVKIGPGGSTEEQRRESALKYVRATVVEPYHTAGTRSRAWDDDAIRYLEANARLFAEQPDPPSDKQLVADGEKLVRAGCTDPMVLYCYGAARQRSGDLAGAVPLLQKSIDGLAKSRYPRSRAFFVPLRLASISLSQGRAKEREVDQLRKLATAWIGEAAGEEEVHSGGQRALLQGVNGWWDSVFQSHWLEVYDAVRANPKADPYVVAVIGGRANKDEGWRERGTGWASDVTPEGWRGFAEHLEEARGLYTKAWRMHPEFPEAPAEMIIVAMAGHGGFRQGVYTWFNRAVAAQVDYQPAYDKLLYALLPRWGGSYDAMHDVGLACLESGRFDTNVPIGYVRSLQMITEDSDGDKSYWTRPDTYQRLKGLFAGYAKAKQTEEERLHRQTLWAGCAWYLGKYDDAHAAFEELGDRAAPEVFEAWHFGATLEEARDESYALSGTQAGPARQAKELIDSGDAGQAAASYRSLLATADGHAAHYYRRQLAEAETEARLERGEWLDLRPDPALTGWTRAQGYCAVEPDGTVRGTTAGWGLWLLCDRDFGHRLEFEGEVDLASFGDQHSANFIVVVDATGAGGEDYIAFQAFRENGWVRVTTDLHDRTWDKHGVDVRDHNTFRVVLWDGKVDVYLNGQPEYRGEQTGRTSGPAPERVGVGSGYGTPGAVVGFRNLRVRLLKAEPE